MRLKVIIYLLRGAFIIGLITIAACFRNMGNENKEKQQTATDIYLYVVAVTFLCYAGWIALKKYEVRRRKLEIDENRMILYLRSFSIDKRFSKAKISRWFMFFFNLSYIPQADLTIEEEMAMGFKPVGALMAIGRPGEWLPTLGASRKQVSHDKWKNEVLRLMQKAKYTVLIGEYTEGFTWEIVKCFQTIPLDRIFIFFPGKRKKYEAFQTFFNSLNLAVRLPVVTSFNDHQFGGIIYFRNNSLQIRHFKDKDYLSVRYSIAAFLRVFANDQLLQAETPSIKRANWFKRIMAFLIDTTLITLVIYLLVEYIDLQKNEAVQIVLIAGGSIVVFLCVYGTSLLGRKTIGKLLLNIHIADRTGVPSSTGQLIGRLTTKPLAFISFIPMLLFAFASRKSFIPLHDRWVKTTVNEVPNKQWHQ